MNKATILTLAISLFLYVSCNNESVEYTDQNNNLRELITSGKTIDEQKDSFKLLSSTEKYNVWMDKLIHLKKMNLPSEHINLIEKLSIELVEEDYFSNKTNKEVLKIVKRLFEITPKADLMNMFFSLEDYSYSGKFDNSSGYLNYEDLFYQVKTVAAKNSKSNPIEECTCRWTCSDSGHTNCEETNTGCGFLWLWSCTRRLT